MTQPLRVLLIDDEPAQAWLVAEYLRSAEPGTVTLETVETLADAKGRLADGGFDAVLLDLCLPDSLGAATYMRLTEHFPTLPVVVMTSLEDEELGAQLVQMGAQDYLVKGQVGGAMLVRTLRYAIERRRAQAERDELIGQLRAALDEVQRLEGMLPICAWCHKIRDDEGYWQRVEVFISERTAARFSHGICPSCMKQVCPDEEVAAAWLTPLDVTDAPALCARLRDKADPVSAFLAGCFAESTRSLLASIDVDLAVPKPLVEAVVAELNRAMEHEQIFAAERFAQVVLDDALLARLSGAQSDDLAQHILINRLLLQAAYPAELAAQAPA